MSASTEILRECNRVEYRPLLTGAFDKLAPLDRAEAIEQLADHMRVSAALAIANLTYAGIELTPDELDAWRRITLRWREAVDARDRLRGLEAS